MNVVETVQRNVALLTLYPKKSKKRHSTFSPADDDGSMSLQHGNIAYFCSCLFSPIISGCPCLSPSATTVPVALTSFLLSQRMLRERWVRHAVS